MKVFFTIPKVLFLFVGLLLLNFHSTLVIMQGYTIPLDKRLAADGRGLQTTTINDKFASLSEALFTAEAKAREAITLRTAMQKELLHKEKAKKEAELRELAMKARMEKAGAVGMASRMDAAGTQGIGYMECTHLICCTFFISSTTLHLSLEVCAIPY
jgi:hypothetical protein